jgi:biopolymer transport protein TolR
VAAVHHPTRKKRRLAHEINVVPYIDVMLVLLVIFMITAPLLTQGVEVDLPETSADTMSSGDEPVSLVVDSRGRYFLDIGTGTNQALSDEELVRRVQAVVKRNPEVMILVRADKRVDYGRVLYGMGLLQEAGASKLGFASNPQSRREPVPASETE